MPTKRRNSASASAVSAKSRRHDRDRDAARRSRARRGSQERRRGRHSSRSRSSTPAERRRRHRHEEDHHGRDASPRKSGRRHSSRRGVPSPSSEPLVGRGQPVPPRASRGYWQMYESPPKYSREYIVETTSRDPYAHPGDAMGDLWGGPPVDGAYWDGQVHPEYRLRNPFWEPDGQRLVPVNAEDSLGPPPGLGQLLPPEQTLPRYWGDPEPRAEFDGLVQHPKTIHLNPTHHRWSVPPEVQAEQGDSLHRAPPCATPCAAAEAESKIEPLSFASSPVASSQQVAEADAALAERAARSPPRAPPAAPTAPAAPEETLMAKDLELEIPLRDPYPGLRPGQHPRLWRPKHAARGAVERPPWFQKRYQWHQAGAPDRQDDRQDDLDFSEDYGPSGNNAFGVGDSPPDSKTKATATRPRSPLSCVLVRNPPPSGGASQYERKSVFKSTESPENDLRKTLGKQGDLRGTLERRRIFSAPKEALADDVPTHTGSVGPLRFRPCPASSSSPQSEHPLVVGLDAKTAKTVPRDLRDELTLKKVMTASADAPNAPGAGGSENKAQLEQKNDVSCDKPTIHKLITAPASASNVPGAGGSENKAQLEQKNDVSCDKPTIHKLITAPASAPNVPGAEGSENKAQEEQNYSVSSDDQQDFAPEGADLRTVASALKDYLEEYEAMDDCEAMVFDFEEKLVQNTGLKPFTPSPVNLEMFPFRKRARDFFLEETIFSKDYVKYIPSDTIITVEQFLKTMRSPLKDCKDAASKERSEDHSEEPNNHDCVESEAKDSSESVPKTEPLKDCKDTASKERSEDQSEEPNNHDCAESEAKDSSESVPKTESSEELVSSQEMDNIKFRLRKRKPLKSKLVL